LSAAIMDKQPQTKLSDVMVLGICLIIFVKLVMQNTLNL
jgi:hypothetical protein